MAREPITSCAVCEVHADAVFRVEGMDCRDEVVLLERRLKPLPGVEALVADVVSQRLRVSYDAARVSTSTLVDAAADAGLRMWLEHEEPKASGQGDARAWLTLAAAVALAGGLLAQFAGLSAVGSGLYLVAVGAGIVHPLRRARAAWRARALDINVLMVIAVAGALAIGEWLEAGSVVVLFAIAQWLEGRTLGRARQAIRALLDLAPREALVRRNGRDQRVAVDTLLVGDVVIVRPGDKVPVDGVVVAGRSDINEAALTGESMPVDKAMGAEVFAGTVNGHGSLDVRVSRVGPDTRMARITHLVEEAQARRAPLEAWVDRFGRWYTPLVAAAALVVAVVPPLTGGDPAVWVYRGLVFLVIACPCALVISTPVSIVAALSAAARQGVLVKGGLVLERLAEVDAVAFDKTGTLTLGQPEVGDITPTAPWTSDDVLRWAAAVEARAGHPLGRAIVHAASRRGLAWPDVQDFQSHPGRGARGVVDGRVVLVGNSAFLREHGAHVEEATIQQRPGSSVVWVRVAGDVAGAITLADAPRPHAREAIEALQEQGIRRVLLLTGDRVESASPIAAALGVRELHAHLTPDQKLQRIEALQAEGFTVAMVGDGINDAPALALADVGVAMGAIGSDVALETADVALMSDDLLRLPAAVRLARATVRTIRTNVAVSLLLKAAFLVAATTGTATLWMAVLADTGASVVVVANALRLLRQR